MYGLRVELNFWFSKDIPIMVRQEVFVGGSLVMILAKGPVYVVSISDYPVEIKN
jgi:hypothetical protein